ncbi:hypothetical protein BRC82_02805 [Halobacteriales archaeon QS_1_67_19]|nr:MAG: hypothetical protein BRC82_02805 [Halobacteriales archaeon QS_1_67_19]
MADEDASGVRSSERDESEGFSFSLPPILLPEVRLPERIRLAFPTPDPPEKTSRSRRVRVSSVLFAALLVDALDALAVVWSGPAALPWVRGALGTLFGVAFAGPLGLAYAWELVAILAGHGWVALAPTATALVVMRALLS